MHKITFLLLLLFSMQLAAQMRLVVREEITFDECMSTCEEESRKEADHFKEMRDAMMLKPGFFDSLHQKPYALSDSFFVSSYPHQFNYAEFSFLTSKIFLQRPSLLETMYNAFWFSVAFSLKLFNKLFY
jgi:hypothetical protein